MDMRDRKVVSVKVYRESYPDLDGILNAKESVPEEFQSSITIDIDKEHDYTGDVCAYFTMSYTRPETDSEMDSRITREKNHLEEQARRELETYKRLQTKFGTNP